MQRWAGLGVALLIVACADDAALVGEGSSSSEGGDDSTGRPATSWNPQGSGGPDDGESGDVAINCGDERVAVGEQCDGDNLGGKTCASFGWEPSSTGLRCGDDCQFDLASCVMCGNGVIDQDFEECDTEASIEIECSDFPEFADGTVGCTNDCRFDFATCVSACGNGEIGPGEECEFDGFAFCDELFGEGWTGEALCSDCNYIVNECSECGDGVAGGWEDCDGSPIGPGGFVWTCEDLFGKGATGEVACSENCFIDTSGCTACNNGVLEEGELCDIFDVGGVTCADVGFATGTLNCGFDCQSYDVSQCSTCGDDVADEGEDCDGTDLLGATCLSLGFAEGELSCDAGCALDLSGCGTCGDGIIVPGETCDGDELGGATCITAVPGAQGGTLACDSACAFDSSGCIFIGEGDVVVTEVLYAAAATPATPDGQWLELYNPDPAQAWDLGGCELDGNLIFETFTIGAGVIVAPQSYVVLGTGDVAELFFTADAQLGPMYSLGNTGDLIRLRCGGVTIDEVIFDDVAPWPEVVPGTAIALMPAALDAVGNDDGANWCAATTEIGTDTFGTPQAANDCAG